MTVRERLSWVALIGMMPWYAYPAAGNANSSPGWLAVLGVLVLISVVFAFVFRLTSGMSLPARVERRRARGNDAKSDQPQER